MKTKTALNIFVAVTHAELDPDVLTELGLFLVGVSVIREGNVLAARGHGRGRLGAGKVGPDVRDDNGTRLGVGVGLDEELERAPRVRLHLEDVLDEEAFAVLDGHALTTTKGDDGVGGHEGDTDVAGGVHGVRVPR